MWIATVWEWLTGWIVRWVNKLFDGKDHTVETRLVCYVAVVVSAICWLSHGIWKDKAFTEGWNTAFVTLAGMVTLVHANGVWANRPANPKGGDSDATQKEGEQ
jgi:hypothetical protein